MCLVAPVTVAHRSLRITYCEGILGKSQPPRFDFVGSRLFGLGNLSFEVLHHSQKGKMGTEGRLTNVTGVTASYKNPQTGEDIRITAPNVALGAFPEYLTKKCLLFYYPETEDLARSIAQCSHGRVELGEIKWA